MSVWNLCPVELLAAPLKSAGSRYLHIEPRCNCKTPCYRTLHDEHSLSVWRHLQILSLVMSVRNLCPVQPLVAAFQKRNRLRFPKLET